MNKFIHALRAYIVFSLLLGLAYPLAITFISQVTMPYQANGSLIVKDTGIIGSRLIGQSFTNPGYFHGRPSANAYDGANSGGTNLGPSSKKLMDSVAERIQQVRRDNGIAAGKPIPADMVLSSASGLDPHVSTENAALQAPRVAKARGVALSGVKKLISENTDPDFIGIWGRPGVNVLKLNSALDTASNK